LASGAKSLKGVQDRLGAINDCVTTIGLLSDDPSAAAAIQKRLVELTRAFQTYWRSHFPQQKRAWWRRWLTEPARQQAAASKQLQLLHR